METFRSIFFDDDNYLGAPGGLRGRPSQQGKLRPGRLSVAIKALGAATALSRVKLPARPPALLQSVKGLRGLQAVQPARAVPPPRTMPMLRMQSPKVRALQTPQKRPITPARRGAIMPPRLPRGGSQLSGPDDLVTFTPNGQVWVTTQTMPLYAIEGELGVRTGDVLTYPDGTAVTGRFWLPKLDLSAAYDPRIPSTVDMDNDPRMTRPGRGRGGWIESPRAQAIFGGRAWEYVVDYHCGFERTYGVAPNTPPSTGALWPTGAVPMPMWQHSWGERLDNNCPPGSKNTRTLNRQYFGVTFDWSTYPPSIGAPIWVYLTMFDPAHVSWVVFDAEIYRADMQYVESAGEPSALPGPAWRCLDFLDAAATGAHGMPQLTVNGRLDAAALGAFVAQFPAWAPALANPPSAMLATIDDIGARAPERIETVPAAPEASPEVPLEDIARMFGGGGGGTTPQPEPAPAPPVETFFPSSGGDGRVPVDEEPWYDEFAPEPAPAEEEFFLEEEPVEEEVIYVEEELEPEELEAGGGIYFDEELAESDWEADTW